MAELDHLRALVQAEDWTAIEFARPEVRPDDVAGLVGLYWQFDDWTKRVAVIQLLQDQRVPEVRPVMLDILRAPLDPDGDNVELTKAAALGIIDERYDDFMRFYDDRAALHHAVGEVLRAHGLSQAENA